MKTSPFLVLAIAAFACIPLLAQQTEVDAGDSAKTTYSAPAGGFGDDAASRSWEMTSVSGELDGKLDSKTAKVGDRVTLKTADKVQAGDGTLIPRGSHLVGHITAVQAHNNSDRALAQIAIAFDHVELKNGQSVAVHSLIRTVRPSGSVSMMPSMDDGDMMSATSGGGGRMGGGRGGGGIMGGGIGAGASASTDPGSLGAGSVGGISGGSVDRTAGSVPGAGTNPGVGNVDAGVGARENSEVQLAGHGDAPIHGGARAAAAARTVPHNTGIPGVMLAGSSTASGLLIDADRRDLEFTSGTRFEMGVVTDR